MIAGLLFPLENSYRRWKKNGFVIAEFNLQSDTSRSLVLKMHMPGRIIRMNSQVFRTYVYTGISDPSFRKPRTMWKANKLPLDIKYPSSVLQALNITPAGDYILPKQQQPSCSRLTSPSSSKRGDNVLCNCPHFHFHARKCPVACLPAAVWEGSSASGGMFSVCTRKAAAVCVEFRARFFCTGNSVTVKPRTWQFKPLEAFYLCSRGQRRSPTVGGTF